MHADSVVRLWWACLPVIVPFCACDWSLAAAPQKAGQKAATPQVKVKVVEGGESHLPASECRKMIVGPGVNQPERFPGYDGFVGWECPVRLREGTMYVSFNAGYWHGSPPTPVKFDPAYLESWKKAGFPDDFKAPRGGRAMIAKSSDQGRTWSKPETLLDTPYDDRHPSIAELSNGILVCTLFTFPGEDTGSTKMDPSKGPRMAVVRSLDGGKTWESEPRRMPPVFTVDATDGPVVELPDGSILLAGEGKRPGSARYEIGVFGSSDSGANWKLLATTKTDHNQFEPSMVHLGEGRLVMITRPEGAIAWSADGGRTWTPPVTFGFRLYAPTLLVLADGTLLCHFGSYAKGHSGLRAIFSTDEGKTWIAPAADHGFLVDNTYGYSRSCLMPDGSAYLAYIGTGGHRRQDAQNNMIWSVRLRVRADHSGIELVPIDGK